MSRRYPLALEDLAVIYKVPLWMMIYHGPELRAMNTAYRRKQRGWK